MNKQAELTRWTPKRLLSLLMALIMTLSLLPTAALAATPASSKYSIPFDAPERMVVGTEYTNARAEVTIGSSITMDKLTVKIEGPENGCTIAYGSNSITNSASVPTPQDLADLSTLSTATQALHVEPISLKFTKAGKYEVTLAVVDGSTAETSVTKTFYVSDITSPTASPTAPIAPINAVEGEPFDVTVNTSYPGNYVFFEYGTETQTIPVSARPDGTGYATARFTARTGVDKVEATLFNPDISGSGSSKVTIPVTVTSAGTPAAYHTVTFHENAAGVYNMPVSQTVENGQMAVEPITPQRDGYTFDGWYKDAACTTPFTLTTPVTEDLHLYAGWKEVTYPVSFYSHSAGVSVFPTTPISAGVGDTVDFNVTVPAQYDTTNMLVSSGESGVSIILAPTSQHTDSTHGTTTFYYHFEVKDQMIDRSDPVNPVILILVNPLPEKTFTVMMPTGHFDAEITAATPVGSTVATDKKSASIVYGGNYTFTVTPHKGYDVEVYVNGAKQTTTGNSYTVTDVTGPQRVEVVESAIPNYNVTFTVPLSGEFFTQSVARDGNATEPSVKPEREGYTFIGWYAADQYPNGAQFSFTTEKITKDTVLFGKLMPKTYIITYDGNGSDGGTVPTPQPKDHGTAIILSTNVPTRTGYTFLGWGMTSTATAANYQPGDPYSVDGNIKLFAVWQKNTYTVSLPTGQGYSINTAQSTTVTHGGNFEFTVTVDPAYAQDDPEITVSGTHTGFTSVEASSHRFDGARIYTCTITGITSNQVVSVNATKNLVYTVTFMTNAAVYQTQEVGHGEKATRPVDPVVEGYKFDGWYTDETFTTAWNFVDVPATAGVAPIPANTVTGPTTIYAKLTPITPKITWVSPATGYTIAVEGIKAGETSATTLNSNDMVVYGSTVTFTIKIDDGYDASQMQVGINNVLLAPKSKSEDGKTYTFEFTAKENTNISVVGVERKTVTIIYNANARDDVSGMPEAQTVKYYLDTATAVNDTIVNQIPVRTGYEFLGWSTKSEATAADPDYTVDKIEAGTATSKFTANTTLYAVWEADALTAELIITDEFTSAPSGTTISGSKLEYAYEGDSITLVGKLSADAQGTMTFYKKAKTATDWTFLGTTSINGGNYGVLGTTVENYKWGNADDTATKNNYRWEYKVEFKPTTDEGYSPCKASDDLRVYSKAISWEVDKKTDATTYNWTNAKNTLTIYTNEARTTTTDKMTANSTYWLQIPAVYELDGGLNLKNSKITKLSVGTHYEITWEYEDSANHWTTYATTSDTDWVKVTPEYSGYSFRAKVTPTQSSIYTKAATYDENGTVVKDVYWDYLITKATAKTEKQATATELAITGADDEAANVTINGASDVFTAAHLAQFEGKKVTLTATVKDASNAAVTKGYVDFYKDGETTPMNEQPIAIGQNGTATYEATTSAFSGDAITAKDTYYAVYLSNDTYSTSDSKADLKAVYIKSTTIQTPIIESKLEGEGGKKATTYTDDLTGLLAGVEHTFKLRTGNDKADWSVVALDGRTVAAENYTIQWITKSGDNAETTATTGSEFKTSDNKVHDEIYVRLNPTGDMKTGADSKKAIIGKKQDVTVTVEASDEINSTAETDVYQLNDITLTATVAAKETSSTMKPTGTVTFYYSVDGTNWTKIGEAKDLAEVTGVMTASIQTDQLPVKAGDNTKQNVEITAVYEGNKTFNASATVNETEKSITAAAGCTTNNKNVTVYSSVVYAGASENKATTTPSTDGITITANGVLKANESSVTLTLGQVYTLDHPIDLSKLTYNTDYTVQWQILKNALQHQDSSAGSYATTDKWEDLPNQTGSSYTGTMEQDAAYRAKITVKDTPIAKGSFTKVDQLIKGRDVYYSNVLVVGAGMATVTTNITTSANQKFNEEGIVSGETATIHVLASGAAKTTPISTVTATITKSGATEPVFNEKANNVNGYTSFAWDTSDLTPGYYTLTVTAESNNGYAPQTITRTLIVRDNAYTLTATKESKVYNGKAQGIDWELTGVDIENALAQKSVVVYYYDKDGKMVEPTQAGKYQYDLYLPASAYWTELTHVSGTFIIEKRPVEVVDLVAQAKVYDGTNNANIQEIILNDSAVDSKGTATGNTGIIDGDSVYAVGTGYTSKDTAGTAKLGVKNVTLKGDDAANYTLSASGYTEDFNIQRSQVKGAIVSGRTYKYTGKDINLAASDIYLIDQAGSQLTNYKVTYYYHNGDGVEKVDAMNKMGKYTVIARPEQDNYKGGAEQTVYVGNTDTPGTLDNSAKSSLITISNTVELYGATTSVEAKATNNATVTVEYQDGTGWSATHPTAAGRYLVKVTTSTGDTAYGLYTVVKARPALTLTATGATYNSAQYNGAPTGTYNGGALPADTYYTYTGGTIQGVAYEAPTEAGDYVVTAHVGKTDNYTAHEISANFTIAKAALTIKADDLQRWQYGSFPDMVASYQGLATGGVAKDTSLRDVQIQPEFLFNEQNGGYTNHAFDQVGTYPVTVRNALARNYTVTYVGGTIATTKEEPKAELAIHGMPDNGTTTENLVYYGDTIQLYAYGYYKTLDSSRGSYNTSSLIEWSVSDASIAEIDQSGLLTIKGVGAFKVTLKRGSGSAAISTDIDVTAEKQEVKVVVPDQDLIYNGAEQKYDGSKFYAENAKGERITATPYMHDGKVKRTNVGSQIITSWVGDTNATYQSEHYCGLFTINVKDVTVTPNEISVTYGDTLGTLGYTESNTVGGVAALTDGKAVSERDAYINLDVLDGYEILVAGRENENYNVKYVTDQTAPDVKVTAKDLSISTGTLNSDGRTSGYLKDNDQFYMNEGFAITGTTFNLTPNDRMYGEVNPVMDYTFAGFVSGDSEADLVTLLPWLVKYSDGTYHNINGNANVAFDKTNHLNGFRATSFMSGMSAYPIDSMLLANSVKNYTLTSAEATQNIYQRPVTLTVPTGVTLTAYKPTIIDSTGHVKTDVLLDLLLNNLVVGQYNDKGGLAELLKHTIKDLDIQIASATYNDSTKTISVTIELGNKNYWTEDLNFTVKVDPTKIVAKYTSFGWTSASVTMVGVDESGHETGPVDVSGKVLYKIYVKDPSITNPKYSDYKGKTPVLNREMFKGSSTGVYIVNYDRLPAGEYVMFAIAEGYTIIE